MHPVIPVENWRKGSQVSFQVTSISKNPFRKMQMTKRGRREKENKRKLCKPIFQLHAFYYLLAVGCSDQKTRWDCCEGWHCVARVSVALQGKSFHLSFEQLCCCQEKEFSTLSHKWLIVYDTYDWLQIWVSEKCLVKMAFCPFGLSVKMTVGTSFILNDL